MLGVTHVNDGQIITQGGTIFIFVAEQIFYYQNNNNYSSNKSDQITHVGQFVEPILDLKYRILWAGLPATAPRVALEKGDMLRWPSQKE